MPFRILLAVLVALLLARTAYLAQNSGRSGSPPGPEQQDVSFRVIFGQQRTSSKVYDGTVKILGGKLQRVEPWRFFQKDAMTGEASWKLEIKRAVFENQPDKPNPVAGGSAPAQNLVPAGLVVTASGATASAEFETRQGNFSVPTAQLVYGKILRYLDDDVVVERVPTPVRLSSAAEEQHDYPSIAVTRQGSVWSAWQAYQDRGDHVYACRAGETPVRLTAEKGDVYRTSIAEDQDGGLHVIWSERRSAEWRLYERVHDGNSWGSRRQITSGTSPNIFQKLISSPGALRLIWVGHDGGSSYLYMSSYTKARGWTAAQQIGGPSVWSPEAAADRQDNIYVAWDSYRNGNYDILFRRIAANGAAEPIEQVTSSPRFEAHASVAIDGQGRPWVAWDQSGFNWGKDWFHEDEQRATVLYQDRSIRVAVKDSGEWKEAADFGAAVPDRLKRYWQLPHLAADGTGRIWALFQMRTSAVNNRDDYWCSGGLWDLYLTTLENGAWRPAALVPQSTGRNEAPFQIAPSVAGVWMTWAGDGRKFPGGAGGYQAPTMVHYDVYAAAASAAVPAGPVSLAPFTAGRAAPQIMHPNEKQDIARIRAYRTQLNGVDYRIMRGDFHRHTDISNDGSGDGSVEDYYRYMIDVAGMDTGIIADHNMGGDVEYNWWRTEKSYDVFHIHSRFTPLFGYERSVNYPNGHRNVVFDHRGVRTLPVGAEENQGTVNSGTLIYPYLRQNRGICMEHSLATGQGTDYRDNDPDLEPLVELYQGYHASYEYLGAPRAETDTRHLLIHGAYRPAGFWWNALAKGLKLGVQASSDHISTHCSYAMIYTPGDDRSQIVENMRRRHAYAATDNIIVDFQATDQNGRRYLMGEAFETGSAPRFTARIIGTDRISQADLICNNEFVYSQKSGGSNLEFEYSDKASRRGENYYYVRVMQQDGNLAWSSPIWVKYR